MIQLTSCPKQYTLDQDKAMSPEETLSRVRSRLASLSLDILAQTSRIDTGRLGIPVYLSVCGKDAKRIMPTRKQMGKGASAAQAEASALMELMERYGFFTYWERLPEVVHATWTEAEARFGQALMPLAEAAAACHDELPDEAIRTIMDLRRWAFVPATHIRGPQHEPETRWIPLDLFKVLGEFNGSSAGNTDVESLLQGACELVERHVCCLFDRKAIIAPTIASGPGESGDPVVEGLLEAYRRAGITLVLKDFSMGMPVPTVAALAYDPATYPDRSEIVFTAGTAASPAKAAARALTEVAQLAGDFRTSACYEASGLPKYSSLSEAERLFSGPMTRLSDLPCVEADDMLDELKALAGGLEARGFSLYAVATTNPDTAVPTHYSVAPGLQFRERDTNSSLGLFTGRLLCEEADPETAGIALDRIEAVYGGKGVACDSGMTYRAHFIPFFRGMLALRENAPDRALDWFTKAEPLQPDQEGKALAAFYGAYTQTLQGRWDAALPGLDRAAAFAPDMKEYKNLRGVCLFKLERYADAALEFEDIVTRLDKGSAMDLQNLGLCRKFLGDMDAARHYLEAALSLDPGLEAAAKHLNDISS